MALINRQAVLSSQLPYEDVAVPEWGGDVRIQALSVSARAALLEMLRQNILAEQAYLADQALPYPERQGLAAVVLLDEALLMIAYSAVDEHNDRIFDVNDLSSFDQLSYNTIARLFSVANRLNAFNGSQNVQVEEQKKS